MLYRMTYSVVVVLALVCASPKSWAGKVGPEFRVNTTPLRFFFPSSIAVLSGGGFIVTWIRSCVVGVPACDLVGQRYGSAGARVGNEFLIGKSDGNQGPSVAALGGDGFVVSWKATSDGHGAGIYAQRYSATGAPVGAQFRVNTITAYEQFAPSVAHLGGGRFVVTWSSNNRDGRGSGVAGQRYSADGQPVAAEFLINTYTASYQYSPSVAALSGGGFVVIWVSEGQDGSESGIYGQRYSAAGARVGGEFRVNSTTVGQQTQPSVAGLRDGGFVATWASGDPSTANGFGVYAQRYSAAGDRVGLEFRVNTTRANDQNLPSVAALSGGGFVVTWTSAGQDGSGWGVYSQRYSAAGTRVGGEVLVNTTRADDQGYSSAAALSGDGFIVTWTSRSASGSIVYGQRFSP